MTDAELFQIQEMSLVGNPKAVIKLADFYLENGNYYSAFQTLARFNYMVDKDGYRKLGYCYEMGYGTKVDVEKAREFYLKAFELEDHLAGYNLAVSYIKEERYQDAIPYLCFGVYKSHIPSIKSLANLYLKGLGVGQSSEIAINLFKKAIDLGDKHLFDVVGKIYYQNSDFKNAVTYFQKGANIFDSESIYHLGICYAKGQGVGRDFKKAIYYYEISANHNHLKSIYNLAMHYQKGLGVRNDLKKANDLLLKYDILSKKSAAHEKK